LLSTTAIGNLKASTRYRLSYHVFKDVTNVPASDPAYSQAEGVSLFINSGTRGSYVLKDFSMSPYLFGAYKPGFNSPMMVDFTTPVLTNSSGANNIGASTLQFRWPSSGKGSMCLTGINLQEIPESLATSRVVVNTLGYPMTGNKVATLVLPQGVSTSGLKWRLRKGNGFAPRSYSVSIPFYAVVTGTNGQPVKDANGNHTLQKNADGTDKSIGGTGTGGQSRYPANDIPAGALVFDADSGEYTYTLDFSSYGKTVQSTSVIDLKATPSAYTAADGKVYYIFSRSTTSTSYSTCSDCYIDVIDSAGTTIAVSPIINIQTSPYQNLKNDALYTFYHQRSGVAIAPSFVAPLGYNYDNGSMSHAAGHKPDTAGCWANSASNIDLHGNNWGNSVADCYAYTKDVTGGWYDAADHGKYVVNGGVALWTLQNMIERLQTKGTLSTAFPAGKLKLPATLNDQGAAMANLSDLMAEARTEMQWMLKMQAPAQLRMKVPLGYQDKTQTGTPVGPTGGQGVYQVDLSGAPLASASAGAVGFGGTAAKLPRLRTKLNLTSVDVGGLVFHAVHDKEWTGIPQNPSADAQPRVLMYPTSAATLNFAAVAAQCSRIWKGVDDAFATRCFNAAILAWDTAKKFRTGFTDAYGTIVPAKSDIFRYEYTNQSWSLADPSGRNLAILQYGFAINPLFNGGGAYGDLRVGDEFYWAGAELYLATATRGTGDTSYHTYGKAQGVLSTTDINGQWSKCEQSIEPIQCYGWINGFDWQNTSALGTLSLLTYNNGLLASATAKANLTSFADKLVAQTNAQGFKFAKQAYDPSNRDTHYEWGANGGVLNRALILGAAYGIQADVTKKQSYLDSAVASMGYLLGRNVLGKSFISGYGNNPLANPHHRWFAKHADVAYPKVPAGYVAGGPNTRDIPALRANAPRYQTQADVNYALVNGDPSATLGGIADSSQKYFEDNVVASCMKEAATTAPTYIPQKCYADHYRSFATNEVAINWQAPLVWVAQFLSENY
jgi:endoglucanase